MDIKDITGYDLQRAAARAERAQEAAKGGAAKKGAEGSRESDSVSVSSRAKQLLQLRKAYDKLEDTTHKKNVHELKERIKEGIHKLSSEEIVSEILRGTIFESA